jgi:hypothetical protein
MCLWVSRSKVTVKFWGQNSPWNQGFSSTLNQGLELLSSSKVRGNISKVKSPECVRVASLLKGLICDSGKWMELLICSEFEVTLPSSTQPFILSIHPIYFIFSKKNIHLPLSLSLSRSPLLCLSSCYVLKDSDLVKGLGEITPWSGLW